MKNIQFANSSQRKVQEAPVQPVNSTVVVTQKERIDNALTQFMIEDEMLDMQIQRADDKERIKLLKRQQEERKERVAGFKQALLLEAKAEKGKPSIPKVNFKKKTRSML